MAITYTWTVTGVKTTTQGQFSNAVVQTYWKKIGTDENGNEGVFSGATPLSAADVEPGEFVPFDQLTEEIVLGWIQSSINNNTAYTDHINQKIADEIQKKMDPVVERPVPWGTEPGPGTP